MPPNTVVTVERDPEIVPQNFGKVQAEESSSQDDNYNLWIFQSSLTLIAHTLIGAVTAISLIFSFRSGWPLNVTNWHILLCVIGYQLLMSQAILSLSPSADWSARFRLVDKRRAHWILQLVGSVLAIAGSFIKILDERFHWHSLHAKFALVALVFTSVSLVNGLTSLWAFELKKLIPANLSKLTHICFGTIAFAAASISLCYGFDKFFFRGWATDAMTNTIIGFTAFFTFVVIINPFITFFNKSKSVFKKD